MEFHVSDYVWKTDGSQMYSQIYIILSIKEGLISCLKTEDGRLFKCPDNRCKVICPICGVTGKKDRFKLLTKEEINLYTKEKFISDKIKKQLDLIRRSHAVL